MSALEHSETFQFELLYMSNISFLENDLVLALNPGVKSCTIILGRGIVPKVWASVQAQDFTFLFMFHVVYFVILL